jgi:predicted nucleic acid-binding protein
VIAVGRERIFTTISVTGLVDTNILVYCFDPRSPEKQRIARELLLRGVERGSICLAQQAIIEFYSTITRPVRDLGPLLDERNARQETERLLTEFTILYPNESVVRTALRGAAEYQLSWYDAHMWAYAEVFGLDELLSEDYQHDRIYGHVRVVNPFR